MTFQHISALLTLVTSISLASVGDASAQDGVRPHFVAESLADFAAGYQKNHHRELDAAHADAHKYHAYRIARNGVSGAVIARSVSIDAAGHLHIVGEPGTVTRGKISSGPGELHILLPIGVPPPE